MTTQFPTTGRERLESVCLQERSDTVGYLRLSEICRSSIETDHFPELGHADDVGLGGEDWLVDLLHVPLHGEDLPVAGADEDPEVDVVDS